MCLLDNLVVLRSFVLKEIPMKKCFLMVAVLGCAVTMACGSAKADTIGSWAGASGGNITVGDVTFHYVSSDLSSTDALIISETPGAGGSSDYYLTVNTSDGDKPGNTLDYTVTINPPAAPLAGFTSVDAAANILPAPSSVDHSYTDGANSTSLKTYGAAVTAPISWHSTSLSVVTTLGAPSSSIHSFTDSYHVQVPEPSTFALLGLGGLGLVVKAVRRRRK